MTFPYNRDGELKLQNPASFDAGQVIYIVKQDITGKYWKCDQLHKQSNNTACIHRLLREQTIPFNVNASPGVYPWRTEQS